MNSLGERLRSKRMEYGVSLDQVADRTKIGARLLAAIEENDFDRLPGGLFRRSFVRQYAYALGFSEEDIASDLGRFTVEEPNPEEVAEQAVRSMPVRAAGRLSEIRIFDIRPDSFLGRALQPVVAFGGLIAVAAICATAYGWWQPNGWAEHWSKAGRISASTVEAAKPAASVSRASLPAATLSAASVPLPGAALPGAQAKATPPASAPTAKAPPPAASAPAKVVPAKVVPATGAPTARLPTAGVAAATPHDGRTVTPTMEVAFRATEPTWVSVTSDGRWSFASALQGGTVRTIAASEMVRVLVGNAGGLEISLNGKPVGPIGPRGKVRIVELTPSGAQIQTTPRKLAPGAEPL